MCEQLGSAGRALALDQVPREHPSPREELWGSKKALLRILRERSRGESRDGGDQITANVAWTTLYDLLCLLLDLGADGESKDGLGRLPSNLLKGGGAMADAAAHLLEDSDWELGDKTREGKTLTDAGEYVDAAVGAVLGDEASGTASLEGDFARLSVDHLALAVSLKGGKGRTSDPGGYVCVSEILQAISRLYRRRSSREMFFNLSVNHIQVGSQVCLR